MMTISGERGSDEFERFCEISWNLSLDDDGPHPWSGLGEEEKQSIRHAVRLAFVEVATPMLLRGVPDRMKVLGGAAVGGGALILFADLALT